MYGKDLERGVVEIIEKTIHVSDTVFLPNSDSPSNSVILWGNEHKIVNLHHIGTKFKSELTDNNAALHAKRKIFWKQRSGVMGDSIGPRFRGLKTCLERVTQKPCETYMCVLGIVGGLT